MSDSKTFAFKLAQKRGTDTRWKARDGVSVAGCTLVDTVSFDYRDNVYDNPWGPPAPKDGGYYC